MTTVITANTIEIFSSFKLYKNKKYEAVLCVLLLFFSVMSVRSIHLLDGSWFIQVLCYTVFYCWFICSFHFHLGIIVTNVIVNTLVAVSCKHANVFLLFTYLGEELLDYQIRVCSDTQSCPALCEPMDCSLTDSSLHGIFQARIVNWVVIFYYRHLLNQGIKPVPPALAGGFFTTVPPGKTRLSDMFNLIMPKCFPVSKLAFTLTSTIWQFELILLDTFSFFWWVRSNITLWF